MLNISINPSVGGSHPEINQSKGVIISSTIIIISIIIIFIIKKNYAFVLECYEAYTYNVPAKNIPTTTQNKPKN